MIVVIRNVSCPGGDHWTTLHRLSGQLTWYCAKCGRNFITQEVKDSNPDMRAEDIKPYEG